MSIVDRTGLATTLQYYADQRLQSITDPADRQITLTYDADGRIGVLTDPQGNRFTYGYDPSGNLTGVTFTPVTWPGSGVQTLWTYLLR